MPKDAAGIQELADLLHGRMVAREEESIQKLKKVVEFATNDDCKCRMCYFQTHKTKTIVLARPCQQSCVLFW